MARSFSSTSAGALATNFSLASFLRKNSTSTPSRAEREEFRRRRDALVEAGEVERGEREIEQERGAEEEVDELFHGRGAVTAGWVGEDGGVKPDGGKLRKLVLDPSGLKDTAPPLAMVFNQFADLA